MDKEIKAQDLMSAVATTNADPFCIEDEESAQFVMNEWENADKHVLTSENEDFEDWAARLDFNDDIKPRKIYVGFLSSHQVAFVLVDDNPYYDE